MKKLFGLSITLAVGYFILRPLFGGGYFPMHDDTQVARVVVMGRALRAGQFPVRWVSDLGYGYGYPIFNFYGPLPYYAGGVFYALGVSGLTATKMMMGLGLLLSGVAMYAAMSDISGVSAGVLAGSLYMLAPYHAVQAYVRGAVGEYYTLIFLPLILWSFWRKKILLGAVATAGLILSHTILGYVGLFLEGVAVTVLSMKKEQTKKLIAAVLLGLGLAAFFWLPALLEMKYTNVVSQINEGSNFRDHFLCLEQLWNSPWGFGGSAKGCLDGLSFKVGKVHLLVGLAALIGIIVGLIREKKAKILVAVGIAIFVTSVFFMLNISQPIWKILPFFAFVQYPWRFLAFAVFGISLVASQIVYVFRPSIVRIGVVAVSVGLVLFVEAKRFTPQYTYNRASGDFETLEDIRFRVSKISDEYLPAAVSRPTTPQDAVRDTIPGSDAYTVQIQQNSDTYKKFQFLSGTDNRVEINVAFFPGWHYMVNEFSVAPPLHNGLPIVSVPSGLTVVQMKFTDTPVRLVGNILSLVSLGLCLYIYDKRKKANS